MASMYKCKRRPNTYYCASKGLQDFVSYIDKYAEKFKDYEHLLFCPYKIVHLKNIRVVRSKLTKTRSFLTKNSKTICYYYDSDLVFSGMSAIGENRSVYSISLKELVNFRAYLDVPMETCYNSFMYYS